LTRGQNRTLTSVKGFTQLANFCSAKGGLSFRFQKAYPLRHTYTKDLEPENLIPLMQSAGIVLPKVGSWSNDLLVNLTPFLCPHITSVEELFHADGYIMIPSQAMDFIRRGDFASANKHMKKDKFGGRNVWEYQKILVPGHVKGTGHWFLLHALLINDTWRVEIVNTLVVPSHVPDLDKCALQLGNYLSNHGQKSVSTQVKGLVQYMGIRANVPSQTDNYICGYVVMGLIREHLGLAQGPLTQSLLNLETPEPLWNGSCPEASVILIDLAGAIVMSSWEPVIVG